MLKNNLKKIRFEKQISQKEIAVTLRVSPPTVSEWESGKKNPTLENFLLLCEILNVSPNELLGYSHEEQLDLIKRDKEILDNIYENPEKIKLVKWILTLDENQLKQIDTILTAILQK